MTKYSDFYENKKTKNNPPTNPNLEEWNTGEKILPYIFFLITLMLFAQFLHVYMYFVQIFFIYIYIYIIHFLFLNNLYKKKELNKVVPIYT